MSQVTEKHKVLNQMHILEYLTDLFVCVVKRLSFLRFVIDFRNFRCFQKMKLHTFKIHVDIWNRFRKISWKLWSQLMFEWLTWRKYHWSAMFWNIREQQGGVSDHGGRLLSCTPSQHVIPWYCLISRFPGNFAEPMSNIHVGFERMKFHLLKT